MSAATFDVGVVGVGAMGAAACDALARRGASVVGIDPFPPGHEMGSSGGETRLIRKAYWEHQDYVPLLLRSYENWRELERRTGQQLLFQTGCLYAGPPDCGLVAGTVAAARRHGLPIEELGPDEVRLQFPQFDFPPNYAVCLDREAGLLSSRSALEATAALAVEAGATLRIGDRVVRWEAGRRGVRVCTTDGDLEVGHLVVTAGSWSGALLADLSLGLRVCRQVHSWVRPKHIAQFQNDRLPAWLVEPGTEEEPGNYYGFPVMPGLSGCPSSARAMKVGHHHPGPDVDPDCVHREVDVDEEKDWRPLLTRFLPAGAGPTVASSVCLYTTSPDGHFIVDHHPRQPNLTLACGFSGHGFKFASVLGEVLADLALDGHSRHPIGFLGLHRFGRT